MNLAGVIVYCVPEQMDEVAESLVVLPGVELHSRTEDGRLVVTAEDVEDTRASDNLMQMSLLPGVISVSLAYHHFEEDAPNEGDSVLSAEAPEAVLTSGKDTERELQPSCAAAGE